MLALLPVIIKEFGRQLPAFWPLVGAALGAVTGSFLSCAAVRLPLRQSLWAPPSQCDSCHTRLTLLDLIPLLTFLALRGRCRHCGVRYGLHNLLWEVSFILIGAALGWFGQPGPFTPLVIICGLSGVALLICAGLMPRPMHKRHTPVR